MPNPAIIVHECPRIGCAGWLKEPRTITACSLQFWCQAARSLTQHRRPKAARRGCVLHGCGWCCPAFLFVSAEPRVSVSGHPTRLWGLGLWWCPLAQLGSRAARWRGAAAQGVRQMRSAGAGRGPLLQRLPASGAAGGALSKHMEFKW